MSEQMTEAAILYWESLDVLGPACREMTTYLDATSDHWWMRVENRWQNQRDPVCDRKVKLYRFGQPGRAHVELLNSKTGLRVEVSDPRRSNAINHYQVILTNTEKHRKELDKIGKPASDTLTQLAEESEFELKPLDNLRLSIENVEFLTDSMSELGDLVADAILKYLNMIEKFDAWLNSR